jgi:hypothetical protein
MDGPVRPGIMPGIHIGDGMLSGTNACVPSGSMTRPMGMGTYCTPEGGGAGVRPPVAPGVEVGARILDGFDTITFDGVPLGSPPLAACRATRSISSCRSRAALSFTTCSCAPLLSTHARYAALAACFRFAMPAANMAAASGASLEADGGGLPGGCCRSRGRRAPRMTRCEDAGVTATAPRVEGPGAARGPDGVRAAAGVRAALAPGVLCPRGVEDARVFGAGVFATGALRVVPTATSPDTAAGRSITSTTACT